MIVRDASIWNVTLESSVILLEVPLTLRGDIYGTGHIGYDRNNL
jgi:hypothetical protein